ncbi:MAG: hypothetical protein ABI457_09685 [Hyphomicrobium sp.]
MPLRRMLPAIIIAFALSIFVCVLAATRHAGVPMALAAGLFSVQVLIAVLRTNGPFWRTGDAQALDLDWAWDNTVLAAIAYAWGAIAMFAVYSLSGLYWRHWWQYGAGMALLALAALVCANYLTRRGGQYDAAKANNILMGVTAAQVIAVGGGLIYLVASGTLHTRKPDWAANYVFIAGGCTVILISLASLLTSYRLRVAPPVST